MNTSTSTALCIAAALFASAPHARSQTPTWSAQFAPRGLMRGSATAVVFDDGSGPALFVGDATDGAGDVRSGGIAKWDGQQWRPFASVITGSLFPRLRGLATFDSGGGAELFAAGDFTAIEGVTAYGLARWNSGGWSELGYSGSVPYFIEVVDDGNGPALYVGSPGTSIAGLSNTTLAKWDGTSWSTAGAPLFGQVADVCAFDDGGGTKLYVAGRYLNWGPPGEAIVAAWDGSSWTSLATTSDYGASSLAVFDDGTGLALYVGGSFSNIASTGVGRLAKLNGSTWSALGSGFPNFTHVNALFAFDDGSGARLYAGGSFDSAGGVSARSVASWDGQQWNALGAPGAGVTKTSTSSASVYALQAFDLGFGPELLVGGYFFRANAVAAFNIARWNGATWSAFGEGGGVLGVQSAGVGIVRALGQFGGEIYAGGDFQTVGGSAETNLAHWDGSRWAADTGAADAGVLSLIAHDDGGGSRLYAGGYFAQLGAQAIAKFASWDGSLWFSPGGPWASAQFAARAQLVFDDGSGDALYVGGNFYNLPVNGARNIARWDGVALAKVGNNAFSGPVNALAAYDDGQGGAPRLCAGGKFTYSQGQIVNNIAVWDGLAWSGLASGLSSEVEALITFDDGSGPKLYAGGSVSFSTANRGVARWDGTTWTAVGDGFNSHVHAFAIFDDGNGPCLYAAGSFTESGANVTRGLARWDGTSWTEVAGGLRQIGSFSGTGYALLVADDGRGLGPALFVGGDLSGAGDVVSFGIARYGRECAAQSYCTSGTSSSGCAPVIAGVGTASASSSTSFSIQASQLEGAKTGHVFYGLSGPNSAAWGSSSHFLCVKAPSQRTGTQPSGGNAGQCDGVITLDWNAYVASHPTSLGVPFSAGQSVWAQCYFRDPAGTKTTALTNGLAFTICP